MPWHLPFHYFLPVRLHLYKLQVVVLLLGPRLHLPGLQELGWQCLRLRLSDADGLRRGGQSHGDGVVDACWRGFQAVIFRQRPVANTPAKASFRSDGSPSDSRPEVDRRPPAGVTVEQVNKAYVTPAGLRVTALREVSFAAAPSEMIALMAPSGSGKSTLLHVVGAMDTVDSGTILVGQHTVTALHGRALVAYRRSVGFVFQRFHLLSALTALDNVLAPLLPYRPSGADRNRARELLDRVGLGERLDARPAQLSGGEQQRVAIARSLVNQPQLLLADEPTGNLDSAAGAAILDLVTELHSESGMTVLIATHDPAVAARCDRIIQLRDGRVVVDQEA